MTLVAEHQTPGTDTPAPPILGPIPELTPSFVREQLDGGTGSEQSTLTRPLVPVGQLRTFNRRPLGVNLLRTRASTH